MGAEESLTDALGCVNGKLAVEHVISLVVMNLPILVVLLTFVYRTKLALRGLKISSTRLTTLPPHERTVPDRDIVLFHKSNFAVVHSSNVRILLLKALVSADPIRKTKSAVIMNSVNRVTEDLIKSGKVHAEAMPAIKLESIASLKVCEIGTYVFPSRKRI